MTARGVHGRIDLTWPGGATSSEVLATSFGNVEEIRDWGSMNLMLKMRKVRSNSTVET
jgi:hypothetical protein